MKKSEPIEAPETSSGWRREQQTPSLPEVNASIAVPKSFGFWRKLLAFSGPGYLVAVGYMDPGPENASNLRQKPNDFGTAMLA